MPTVSAKGEKATLHTSGTNHTEESWSMLPPEEQQFSALFFRRMFDRAETLGYMQGSDDGKSLHVSNFHMFCRRMSDAVGSQEILFDPHEVFDPHRMRGRRGAYISWTDMRHALEDLDIDGLPKLDIRVPLNPYERVNMILNGNVNSMLGSFWGVFILVLILFSVAYIATRRLHGLGLDQSSLLVFSFDYLMKLACSPFVRHAVADQEFLIRVAVPEMDSPGMPPHKTKLQRAMIFALNPMNLLDLVSILPFWIDHFVYDFPLKLGFLRALRVLRVLYSMKLGGFSDTLAILGETLKRSMQALLVMVIWILMISILTGAVMQQFEMATQGYDENGEPSAWSFDGVLTSVIWVVGRLCNMHGSVQEKHHIPLQEVTTYVVMFVGIVKGCVLLVPVGQIAAAFQIANAEFVHAKKIEEQIQRESCVPLGTDWVKDPMAPSVEVEVLSVSLQEESSKLDGLGTFNVPLLEARSVSATVLVPINSKTMQRMFRTAKPSILVRVNWEPSTRFRRSQLKVDPQRPEEELSPRARKAKVKYAAQEPEGKLEITVESGEGFVPSADGGSWRCRLRVPVRLHGKDPMQEWVTQPSAGLADEPDWEGTSQVFHVHWEVGGVKDVGDTEKQSAFQSHVLEIINERGKRIEALVNTS